MTSGHDRSPIFAPRGTGWPSFSKCRSPIRGAPTFSTTTWGSTFLSKFCTGHGLQLTEYLAPRLFAPLARRVRLLPQHSGREYGAGGLLLKTEDVAKFALLFLQGGLCGGKSVLPAGWAEEMTRIHEENSRAFRPRGAFFRLVQRLRLSDLDVGGKRGFAV
jgi:CubicO group peptidase (beta-lactamase class C family)